jgi:hypothetical protein
VRNGIANLLSLPQLEDNSFTVSYQTSGEWIVTTPHSKEIIFYREADGVCHDFPYLITRSTAAVASMMHAWVG